MSSTCFKRLNESCKTAPRFRPIQIKRSFQNQRFGIQLFCATRPLLVFVCCRSCTEFNDIDRENHFCSRQQLGEWVLSLVAVLGARFLVPFPSLSTLKSLNCLLWVSGRCDTEQLNAPWTGAYQKVSKGRTYQNTTAGLSVLFMVQLSGEKVHTLQGCNCWERWNVLRRASTSTSEPFWTGLAVSFH